MSLHRTTMCFSSTARSLPVDRDAVDLHAFLLEPSHRAVDVLGLAIEVDQEPRRELIHVRATDVRLDAEVTPDPIHHRLAELILGERQVELLPHRSAGGFIDPERNPSRSSVT